jgi:hypothetical protein
MEEQQAEAAGVIAALHGVEVDGGGAHDAEGVPPELVKARLEELPPGQQLPPLEASDEAADAYTAPVPAPPPPSDLQLAEQAALSVHSSSGSEASEESEGSEQEGSAVGTATQQASTSSMGQATQQHQRPPSNASVVIELGDSPVKPPPPQSPAAQARSCAAFDAQVQAHHNAHANAAASAAAADAHKRAEASQKAVKGIAMNDGLMRVLAAGAQLIQRMVLANMAKYGWLCMLSTRCFW